MKTFRIVRNFDPARLHAELSAAGVAVVTVRAGAPGLGEPAFYGVIVTGDSATAEVVNSVVAAHVEARIPSRAADPTERQNALSKMERL